MRQATLRSGGFSRAKGSGGLGGACRFKLFLGGYDAAAARNPRWTLRHMTGNFGKALTLAELETAGGILGPVYLPQKAPVDASP